MKVIEVTSLTAQGLDVYGTLTEAQLRNRLEPEKGLLLIKTDPPGADVRQGGVSLGATPLLVTTLDTDRPYAFDLECIGYQKKRIDVTLSGRTPVARTEKLVLDSVLPCSTPKT